jgi:uncharacterized membrane protein
MTQARSTIDTLIAQDRLPPEQAGAAAHHLEVYPSRHSWLAFFDKALLVIGSVALALALVFFIAYNWLNMGKLGKFALVEGALVITILGYALLAYQRKHKLVQQLLLLVASIITGSLLALFGQVYQTGADTWQLFANWALLIIPWVFIARLPALWLLWLGLINASIMLYTAVTTFFGIDYFYQSFVYLAVLSIVNFIALILWLGFMGHKANASNALTNKAYTNPSSSVPSSSAIQQHWSTYLVGLVSAFFMTRLAVLYSSLMDNMSILLMSLGLWALWGAFMWWRFYKRQIDVLMLTYLCGSAIIVIMVWLSETLMTDWDAGNLLILALLLLGLSSAAVVWLRRAAQLAKTTTPRRVL